MTRRGLDTSALVRAHMPGVPDHAPVRSYLLRELTSTDVKLALTVSVVQELLHVITDARRFEPPVSMEEALALAGTYIGRSNVELLATDEAATRLAIELMGEHALGRKRIADTFFAATLLVNGIEEVITCDPGDFSLFGGLRVIDPRSFTPGP